MSDSMLPGAGKIAIFPTAQIVRRLPDAPAIGPAQSGGKSSTEPAQSSGQESDTAEKSSAQSGSKFLAEACKAILGSDAGLHLHYITGWPERSCYHYAAGDRKWSVDFLRAVIHSASGEAFFNAFMHECKAPWWLDFKHAAEIGRRVLEITKRG